MNILRVCACMYVARSVELRFEIEGRRSVAGPFGTTTKFSCVVHHRDQRKSYPLSFVPVAPIQSRAQSDPIEGARVVQHRVRVLPCLWQSYEIADRPFAQAIDEAGGVGSITQCARIAQSKSIELFDLMIIASIDDDDDLDTSARCSARWSIGCACCARTLSSAIPPSPYAFAAAASATSFANCSYVDSTTATHTISCPSSHIVSLRCDISVSLDTGDGRPRRCRAPTSRA